MAAPVNWRIKGVNKTTRQMAADAAARSGLSIAEWLERAINNNVGVLPREKDTPLVSATLLDPARERPPGKDDGQRSADNLLASDDGEVEATAASMADDEIKKDEIHSDQAQEQKKAETEEQVGNQEDTGIEDRQAELRLLQEPPKEQPRRVPNISPTLFTGASRRPPSNLPRIVGGLFLIALIAASYWLIDENAKNKLMAENEAIADRTAAEPGTRDAGNTDQGQVQRKPGSPPLTPLQRLTAAATKGDARAQQDLGLMYVQGNGVARDPKTGALWLEKSAGAGMPMAQYQLGLLYQKGLGVAPDMNTAFGWIQKAARQGHVRAQYDLGTLFAEGKGTKRNYAEAARWFTRASRAGLAEAHYSLGMIHENGLGVARDQRKAAAYYRSALAAGSAHAAEKLTKLEPALKELSAPVETALVEPDPVPSSAGSEATADGDRPLSAAGIKNLQQLLTKLDLAPGPADGILGDRTIEAIKLYQRFAGLPVDGKPTVDLLLDLRQVVGAMASERPGAGSTTTP